MNTKGKNQNGGKFDTKSKNDKKCVDQESHQVFTVFLQIKYIPCTC